MSSSLRFTGDLPPWLVVTAATIAALLVVVFYVRETRALDSRFAYWLPGLRAAAVAMVIFILAGPVWHRTITVGTLGRVIFAVDVSKSMSVTDTSDTSNPNNRLQRALAFLSGDANRSGWIEQLAKTHFIEVVAFDSGTPSIIHHDSLSANEIDFTGVTADGNETALSSPILSGQNALESANRSSPNDTEEISEVENQRATNTDATRAAVVFFSDGRNNAGESPTEAARRFRSLGGTVHAVGMGSQDELPDVGISEVRSPEVVASDGRMAGEIDVHQAGFAGQPVDLRIEQANGQVVWQKQVIPNVGTQTAYAFELDVKEMLEDSPDATIRSIQRRTVALDLKAIATPAGNTSDEDTLPQNNTFPFRVAVSTRDRRLLIVDGSSRWEVRYLRNLFERDPGWTVDTVIFGPGTDSPRLERGNASGEFPANLKDISRYDAIVLGEISWELFEPFDAKLLADFVSRGGGLVVVDGHYGLVSELARRRLAEIVPVRHLRDRSFRVKSLTPTLEGIGNPAINLAKDADRLHAYWERLPSPDTTSVVEALPGSEVWVSALGKEGQQSPWLVTRLYGAGRVFYVASDQTWRWRYKVADQIHAKFWNQLMIAAMLPPYAASDEYASIGTDKVEYDQQDSVTIRARLRTIDGFPIADATVDALLVSGNQVVQTVPMVLADAATGAYRAEIGSLDQGQYDVRLQASGFDAKSLRVSTPIWVGDRGTQEWRRTSLDETTLAETAAAGGGKYFHESEAAALIDELEPLSSGRTVQSDVVIWQSFYWFWAIITMLGLEWLGRKRCGLI